MTAGAFDPSAGDRQEALVEAALAGDSAAERRLFQNLTVRFRLIAKRYAVETDAEDLAQEACMTIHEKYRTEKFSKSFHAWAHGVLRMKIGNYLQHKKTVVQREIALEGPIGATDSSANVQTKRHLLECLKNLLREKPRYARVLNLSHQGYTTEQICERIQMTANHYYVSLNRSRSLLRVCLESKGVSL